MLKKHLILFTLLCFSSVFFAQTKDELMYRQKFWESNNTKSKATEVPEKWQNESAVILYLEEFYEYTNNGKKMYNPFSFHQRIKLLDKAAVEEFSEFQFEKDKKIGIGFINYSKDETTVGIKIIKADGTEKILDIAKETITQDQNNKIAIPGLEVGDILDIFIYENDYLKAYSGYHEYNPQEEVLSAQYPIVYRKIAVEVENDYFINMESYNGAPKIKEEETDRRSTKRYVLEAQNINKSDFPRWYYPFTELPSVKFQVVFALKRSNESNANVFLDPKDAVRKTGVSKDEILDYYGDRFTSYSKKSVKDILEFLEEKGVTDKREQLEQALYYIRHKSYNRFVELMIAREQSVTYYPQPCGDDYMILNENRFVNYMAGLAKQLEIDYDIIVATPEYDGSIDDLLIRANVAYGLRFNFAKPLYFFNLSPHVQADYFPKYLEGTKVYMLNVKKNRKLVDVLFDTLPVTTAEENLTSIENNITFSDDFKTISFSRDSRFSGHFKTEELNNLLFFGDYLEEEFKKYDTRHFYHCKKKQNKALKTIQSKMEALFATYRKEHEKRLKERIKNELSAEADSYNYTVVNSARYSSAPLEIKEDFTVKDEYVKKAGPNFIVEVGKFIEGQVQLEDDELDRALGVYIDNAKTFAYKTSITIPAGYTVVGLEKLNKNVSNATGSFVSTAIIENNKLVFTTKKVYAKRKYSAEEWKQMIPWLNAAYNFSQEKVMFKKG